MTYKNFKFLPQQYIDITMPALLQDAFRGVSPAVLSTWPGGVGALNVPIPLRGGGSQIPANKLSVGAITKHYKNAVLSPIENQWGGYRSRKQRRRPTRKAQRKSRRVQRKSRRLTRRK